ncbi:acetylserotonin O-methyltransferase-like [Salvia hispanica]|uniref:acetylserotonin O-methyltransferase-like n=1 Tax=Salvia hispanica TaxID=49212 RepID=UPI002008F85B|nr:acetylserotonin O-methyltransferase-like [Salvia hispanica]XP_047951740.1 acetylserotonin O-methyltransferase-like [Salvia hispanica]
MVGDEEVRARAEAWSNAFGYIKSSAIVCAVELALPDILENHGGPMSLSQLSAAANCPEEPLFRLMRFLIFHGIFKKDHSSPLVYYDQTPLSRFFTSDKLGAFMLLQSTPATRNPTGLSAEALRNGTPLYLRAVNGADPWGNPAGFGMKVFTDAMAAKARDTTRLIIRNYPEAFDGIGSVVDVGGRHGMALSEFVQAFPWLRGISFDLPEVVAEAPPPQPRIELVGGSMFESVPKADAVMLMSILHDWGDQDCIEILKKCKEAIPVGTGKVMIVDAIINEENDNNDFTCARLSLDMIMLAVTEKGKERTYREWAYLLKDAGFSTFKVKSIDTVEFVIEAFP